MHPLRIALIIAGLLAAGAFYPNHSYNYFILFEVGVIRHFNLGSGAGWRKQASLRLGCFRRDCPDS